MLYLDGMGPRQSMAVEILDTVRFGGLDKIKGANGYSKKDLTKVMLMWYHLDSVKNYLVQS